MESCPKCNHYTFAYDPYFKTKRCFFYACGHRENSKKPSEKKPEATLMHRQQKAIPAS